MKKKHISLIGMSGVGKTTLGKILAKKLTLQFIDVDDEMENREQRSIYEILTQSGEDYFLKIEEGVCLNLNLNSPSIISTGGSMIYCSKAMNFLKLNSIIIFLESPLNIIKQQTKNLHTRGIVGLKDNTYEALFEQRKTLYKKYADIHYIFTSHPKSKSALENLIIEINKYNEINK